MKKNNKLITFAVVFILLVGIGYAALRTQLNINGNATINVPGWDVHFNNISNISGVTPTSNPTITNATTVTYEVELNAPGEYFEFDVDVVNAGTVDAMIDNINVTGLDNSNNTVIIADEEYHIAETSVTYSDGLDINQFDKLAVGSTETIKVRVNYNDMITNENLPTEEFNVSLTLNIDYIQADSNANEVSHQGVNYLDLDSDGTVNVGDMVTIGTERFYIISNDGTNVRALAEWNLLVGNETMLDTDDTPSSIEPLSNPTGLQDSTARATILREGVNMREVSDDTHLYDIAVLPFIGTIAFSNTNYWTGYDGETIDLDNSNNLINSHLVAYKNSLASMGLEPDEVTLITKNEVLALGCNSSQFICDDAPRWVYQTSYWTRSAYNNMRIWFVRNFSEFAWNPYDYSTNFGIRPVISIPLSEI